MRSTRVHLHWRLSPALLRNERMLTHSRASIKEGKGLSHDEFWQAVDERTSDTVEAV